MIEFFVLVLILLILLNVKAFDRQALLVSFLFGSVIWVLRGLEWFIVLFVFLLLGVLATFFNARIRRPTNPLLKITNKAMDFIGFYLNGKTVKVSREVDNVLSNGLVPFMAAIYAFPYIYLGSLSAALADTLSSEIGSLSTSEPCLITNIHKKVPRGTNGGVSLLGSFAAALGALIIALLAYYLFSANIRLFFAVFICGFLGSMVDSFFGAWLENREIITNGAVNFMTTLFGGLLTVFIMSI